MINDKYNIIFLLLIEIWIYSYYFKHMTFHLEQTIMQSHEQCVSGFEGSLNSVRHLNAWVSLLRCHANLFLQASTWEKLPCPNSVRIALTLWMNYQCTLFQINYRIAKSRLVTNRVIVELYLSLNVNWLTLLKKLSLLKLAHISTYLWAVMAYRSLSYSGFGGLWEVIV